VGCALLLVRTLHALRLPEELYPKEACDNSKAEMRAGTSSGPAHDPKPHAMREGRRVPIKSLMRNSSCRITITGAAAPTPLQPDRVTLP